MILASQYADRSRPAQAGATVSGPVPRTVREVLRSSGQPLEAATRSFMESRFGHDFSQVRVHTDARADASARLLRARAYAFGRDIVFANGQYLVGTADGRRLLAHELAHVVQQSRAGSGSQAEALAQTAAERATSSQTVLRAEIGGAPPGLYRQEEDRPERPPALETVGVTMTWEEFLRLGTIRLTPPSLTVPSLRPPTLLPPGALTLRPLTGLPPALLPGPYLPRPALLPRPSLPTPAGFLTPPFPATSPQAGQGAPELPSRLPLLTSGRFSFGLRLGFPELESKEALGAPPSRVAELLRQGEIMNQRLTGKVPSTWEAVDKGKLAQALWGIFSTKIAPDTARRLASRLTTRAGPAGWSFELDLTLLTDFSGGGLSFTVRR